MSSKRLFYGNNSAGSVAVAGGGPASLAALGAATFSRADASTCATSVDQVSVLQLSAANVLRDNHWLNGVRTILLEESRQNLFLRSQDFATTWTVGAASILAAQASPDGGTNAQKLREDNTNAQHVVRQSVTKAASALPYAFTAFSKQSERSWLFLQMDDATANNGSLAWFDVANTAVGTINKAFYTNPFTSVSSRIAAIGNGWDRCAMMGTTPANTPIRGALSTSTGDTVTGYPGTTNSGLFLFGGQLEQATFPTSYIPTVAAAVTRAVDALSLAGVPFAGTLFYHYFDLSTGAWADAVAAYTANTAIVPSVNRAYSHIAVIQGTQTAAQCKAILGGFFP